ncbi:transcription antitermination factor NusB [bacterium]|nr:transcription antitermination factor NusB [bacterium]MCI0566511.1 transcription antitermination factor NusB [bacterium]MCI0680055.1 transcription antitermination factor NusB [bacterium]
MANRHLSRSIVLQTLFEWDFRGKKNENIPSILERNIQEFAPGAGDSTFVKNLAENVLKRCSTIDEVIAKAAPEWPIERISIVDRNILRIGLYELLFADKKEVPAKVAINESIELAKTFGGENSGKFVNGVLGAVYKEMGEPGKDDAPKRTLDKSAMPIEKLSGAVVYSLRSDEIRLAFVHDIFGHWTLSKGHLKEEEEEKEGTARVVKEEISLNVEIKDKLGSNEYIASDPEKGKIRKQVNYYLAEATSGILKLAKSGGLDDAAWFPLESIPDLNMYDDILPIVTKGINILTKK